MFRKMFEGATRKVSGANAARIASRILQPGARFNEADVKTLAASVVAQGDGPAPVKKAKKAVATRRRSSKS